MTNIEEDGYRHWKCLFVQWIGSRAPRWTGVCQFRNDTLIEIVASAINADKNYGGDPAVRLCIIVPYPDTTALRKEFIENVPAKVPSFDRRSFRLGCKVLDILDRLIKRNNVVLVSGIEPLLCGHPGCSDAHEPYQHKSPNSIAYKSKDFQIDFFHGVLLAKIMYEWVSEDVGKSAIVRQWLDRRLDP